MKAILLMGAPPREGSAVPSYLLEYQGMTVLERILLRLVEVPEISRIVVPIHHASLKKYGLQKLIGLVTPKAVILPLAHQTAGALCTALMCIDHVDDEELLILNSDEILNFDFKEVLAQFRAKDADGGVVAFSSVNPIYSFVRLDENDLVVEASEKVPITRNATVGFYYYKNGTEFTRSAKSIIMKHAGVGQAYYVCPSYNEMVLMGRKIACVRVDGTAFIPLKNEYQIHGMVRT